MIKDAFINHRFTEDLFEIYYRNQKGDEFILTGYPVPGYDEDTESFWFCNRKVPIGVYPLVYLEFSKVFKVFVHPSKGGDKLEY